MPRRVTFSVVTSVLVLLLSVPLALSQPARARPAARPAAKPAPTPAPAAVQPLAVVNGEAISRDKFQARLRDDFGGRALRELIEESLLLQEAHRLQVGVTSLDVDRRLAQMKAEYPNEAAFAAMLSERGLSLDALRREVQRDLLLQRIVDKMAGITEDQVAKYYETHSADFSQPTRVHLFAVSTENRRDAYLAAERLAQNEDFAAVAKELSKDDWASKGGDRGWVTAEQVKPEAVRVAAFGLEPGARSEPIEAETRFYVLWVKEREPGSVVALAAARPQIQERLRAEKGVSPSAVLTGLVRRANVKVNDPAWAFVGESLERTKRIQVIVDGKPLDLAQPPILSKTGRVIVPAKPLLTAVGATMKWWAATRTLQVFKGPREVWLSPDSTIAIVNKTTKVTIDQAPTMQQGLLYVAPRWLVEQLGGSVVWSAESYTLTVKSTKASAGPAAP